MTNVDAPTKLLTSSAKWGHNSAYFLGLSGAGERTRRTGSLARALSSLVSSLEVTLQAFINMPAWDELTHGYTSPLTHNGPASDIPLRDEEEEGQRDGKASGHLVNWLFLRRPS